MTTTIDTTLARIRAQVDAARREAARNGLPIALAASETLPQEYYVTGWSFDSWGIRGQLGHRPDATDAEICDMVCRISDALLLDYRKTPEDDYTHICAVGEFRGVRIQLWTHVECAYKNVDGAK